MALLQPIGFSAKFQKTEYQKFGIVFVNLFGCGLNSFCRETDKTLSVDSNTRHPTKYVIMHHAHFEQRPTSMSRNDNTSTHTWINAEMSASGLWQIDKSVC